MIETIKIQPLKNKLQEDNINIGKNEIMLVENFFYFEDVKLALQGLLNEIEEQKGLIKMCDVCKSINKIENVIITDTLKSLIKKWFPDVI